MNTLHSRLNLTTVMKGAPARAYVLIPYNDNNYYEAIALYCAENDINDVDLSHHCEEVEVAAEALESFCNASSGHYDEVAFWLDAE